MKLEQFLIKLNDSPTEIGFADTMAAINANFRFTPTGFIHGNLRSEAGQNEGSCKIFALAQQLQLTDQACLHCFGDYYRRDVLEHPNGLDHGNIRQILLTGLAAVQFDSFPLQANLSTGD